MSIFHLDESEFVHDKSALNLEKGLKGEEKWNKIACHRKNLYLQNMEFVSSEGLPL